jgi:hypothetical protein
MLHRKTFHVSLLSLFLLLTLLLTACQASSLRIGFVQRASDKRMSLRYQTFTAIEEQQETLEAGDTLVLAYDVVVTKGALTIAILDPEGTAVWDTTLREDGSNRVRIPITVGGVYTVRFRGDDTGGRTELSWEIER